MSRIGKHPVAVPAGVTITVGEHNSVTVKGPKGELTQSFSPEMILEQDNGVLTVKRPS
ncbi:MAG: 50S ribosomal protein L6, partial [Clostridia bacterium]|nr:50S ribosomal protein L6 [Clostridia bacterium]